MGASGRIRHELKRVKQSHARAEGGSEERNGAQWPTETQLIYNTRKPS